MRVFLLHRARRLHWLLVVCLVSAAQGPSCSLVLEKDTVQCENDVDCVRFANAVCSRSTSLCIRRPTSSVLTPDAAALGAGPAADGGSAGDLGGDRSASADFSDNGRPEVAGATGSDGTASDVRRANQCADLDHDNIADCTESLLVNSDFLHDVAGWIPELNVAQSFLPNDGEGDPGSGSIGVTNASQSDTAGSTIGGSWQCVRITGGRSYDFYGQVLVSIDQGPGTSAGASFQMFGTGACTGAIVANSGPLVADAATTGWRLLRGVIAAPAGTMSLAVRLVVVKAFRQQPTQALFDNVLLRAR